MTSLDSANARSHDFSSARSVPALIALALGLVLFLGAGFAWPAVLHNATHDTRHALGLPCH